MDDEFYKELYYQEFETKKWIDALVKQPISWLIILIGSFFYIYRSIEIESVSFGDFKEIELKATISFILSVFVFLFLTKSLFHLSKMFFVFTKSSYSFFSLSNLSERENELIKYYKESQEQSDSIQEESKLYAKKELMNEMIEDYKLYTINNEIINEKRLKNYYKLRKNLILALWFLFILAIININSII